MPHKYYIATGLENHGMHNYVRDTLTPHCNLTYDWTTHGSVWSQGEKVIQETAHLEHLGVAQADFVIGLLPGGRGTHIELGMAIALGRSIYLYSNYNLHFEAHPDTCAFYHHSCVRPFTALGELIDEVIRIYG